MSNSIKTNAVRVPRGENMPSQANGSLTQDLPDDSEYPLPRGNKSARLDRTSTAHITPIATSPTFRKVPSRDNSVDPESPLRDRSKAAGDLEEEVAGDESDPMEALGEETSPANPSQADPFVVDAGSGEESSDDSMKAPTPSHLQQEEGAGSESEDEDVVNRTPGPLTGRITKFALAQDRNSTSGMIRAYRQAATTNHAVPPPDFFIPPPFDTERRRIPTRVDDNPHGPIYVLQPPEPDVLRMLGSATLNDGNFHCALFYPMDLLQGLLPVQLETMIKDSRRWVAIHFFNGGNLMHEELQNSTQKLKDWLQDADISYIKIITPFYAQGLPGLSNPPSSSRSTGNDRDSHRGSRGGRGRRGRGHVALDRGNTRTRPPKNAYEGLNTAFVKVEHADDVDMLTQWQTFALDNLFTFHALPLFSEDRPWVVCLIYTNEEGTDRHTKQRILYAIKQGLWSDGQFISAVSRRTTSAGTAPMSKVLSFTNSLDLQYNGYEITKPGASPKVWCLYAPPFTAECAPGTIVLETLERSDTIEKSIRTHISKLHFHWRDTIVWGETVECALCKINTHHTFQCPFPAVAGWQGPSESLPKEIEKANKKRKEARSGMEIPPMLATTEWNKDAVRGNAQEIPEAESSEMTLAPHWWGYLAWGPPASTPGPASSRL
ncbi:hypothetical protein F5878DRAFT_665015 [Lentinula raphanica]|uniref:Uncharacterized protein n=1 Tax=Lentinula raphanica TaxID=153919 RepID=A0AA38U8J8_9AGAR|nr:hypothetical protein F5878DRAFT_665015 [Lentinula raphanica]